VLRLGRHLFSVAPRHRRAAARPQAGAAAAARADTIVSNNIGCIQHLQSGTTTPVRHWIEVLDDAMAPET